MLDKKTIESITKEDIKQLSMEQLKWAYSRYLSIVRKNRRDNVWSQEQRDDYYKKQYKQRMAREGKRVMAEVKWKKGFKEQLSANGSVLRWYHKGKLVGRSCRMCCRILEPTDFNKCSKNPDHLNYICRECMKIKRNQPRTVEYQTRYRKSSMHRELHRLYIRDRYHAGKIKGKGVNYIKKGGIKDDKEMYYKFQ